MVVHKEEIIQIHRVLFLISEYLREVGIVQEMPEYEKLLVRPFHVNKPREEHMMASLILSKELLENILRTKGGEENCEDHELYIAIKALENMISRKREKIRKNSKK